MLTVGTVLAVRVRLSRRWSDTRGHYLFVLPEILRWRYQFLNGIRFVYALQKLA